MNIRAATRSDVEAVLPLVRQLIELHTTWDPTRFETNDNVLNSYRHWLGERSEDPSSVFIVADAGEAIVAFLIGTVESNIPIYRTVEYGYIHDVWVEPAYRNEGLASSITLLALERFKEIGVTQVRLETALANDAARSLFASCGFRTSTHEMLCEL